MKHLKNLIYIVLLSVVGLPFVSCKKEAATAPQPVTKDTTQTIVTDSVKLKLYAYNFNTVKNSDYAIIYYADKMVDSSLSDTTALKLHIHKFFNADSTVAYATADNGYVGHTVKIVGTLNKTLYFRRPQNKAHVVTEFMVISCSAVIDHNLGTTIYQKPYKVRDYGNYIITYNDNPLDLNSQGDQWVVAYPFLSIYR